MINRLMCAILFLALLPIPAATQGGNEQQSHDGEWWIGLDSTTKIGVVMGLFDGADLGSTMVEYRMLRQGKSTTACALRVTDAYNEAVDRFFGRITVGNVIIGLNAFYRDYRNRKIIIPNATWLVLHGISGTPQKEVEALTERYRQEAIR